MMTCFYQTSSAWQIVLLVISQLAVISLAAGFILLFKRKCKLPKMIGMGALLLLNATLYIFMQIDSRITGAEQGLHLHVPYLVLMLVTVLSIALGAWLLLSETKNRKTINHRSIKESFDNLPTFATTQCSGSVVPCAEKTCSISPILNIVLLMISSPRPMRKRMGLCSFCLMAERGIWKSAPLQTKAAIIIRNISQPTLPSFTKTE